MKTVRYQRLAQDARDIKDGEIFTVFTESPPKPFVKTEEQPHLWAFCFKIKGRYAFSSWANDNVGREQLKKSQKEIMYINKNGWYPTGEAGYDEIGEHSKKYQCLYCGNTAFGTEINGPCLCRKRDENITKSGIIVT